MNILGFNIERNKKAAAQIAKTRGTQTIPIDNYVASYHGADFAGASVNHTSALTLPSAFAAISIKAENMASLPKQVFKRSATGRIEANKHPVYKLIHYQPNKFMTDFTFWEKMEGDVAGWGNAVAIIETNALGYPMALWPVNPDNYLIKKSAGEIFYHVPYGDFAGTYHASEVLHFKFFTRDGINGIDPITYHAQSLGVGLSGQKFAGDFFEKKGAVRGTYEIPGELGDTAFNRLQNRIKQFGNNETPILEGGLTFKPHSISPDAMQAIETRIFSIQDASRIWKVPVSLLAEHTHSTFTNTEQQDIQFVKYGLRPECKRFETEIETKLFTDSERDEYNVKFDLRGLLRGDLKTQAEWYHKAIIDGWLSRNEVRALENLNSVDGLSEYLVPVNMTLPEALQVAIDNAASQNQPDNNDPK